MSAQTTCPKCGTDAYYLFADETQCPDCAVKEFEAPILAALYRDSLPTVWAGCPEGACNRCFDGMVCSMEENYEDTFRDAGVNIEDARVRDIVMMLAREAAADEAANGFEILCGACEDEEAEAADNAAFAQTAAYTVVDDLTDGTITAAKAAATIAAVIVNITDDTREYILELIADQTPAVDEFAEAQDAGFLF